MKYIKNMNTTLMNSVNWHPRWLSVMCAGLMAFMLFGVLLSTGCSTTVQNDLGNNNDPVSPPPM